LPSCGVFAPFSRVAWSLAADFRRARICLLCTVFRYLKAGLNCQEHSPFSPVTFVPDDGGKYTTARQKSDVFSSSEILLIHRCAQILVPQGKSRCIKRWIMWGGKFVLNSRLVPAGNAPRKRGG